MRASMAALVLDERSGEAEQAAAVRQRLASEHRIMVSVYAFAGMLWLRISAQIYNSIEDYERLGSVFRTLMAGSASPRA